MSIASGEATSRRRLPLMPITIAASAVAIAWGWSIRDEYYLSAESGLGYRLGIVGLACMTLLLLYSLRKRLPLMGTFGHIRYWFGIHMFLGVAGPVAILYHANFQLGSLNSNVALLCVLVVSSSGLIGRFLYPKIHHGLYGHRASLEELRREAGESRSAILSRFDAEAGASDRLAEFEADALDENTGLLGSIWRIAIMPIRSRRARRQYNRMIEASAVDGPDDGAAFEVDAYLDAIRRVAGFRGYERLFALWHAFHLPFCVMLFLAAFVHVVAVHMY